MLDPQKFTTFTIQEFLDTGATAFGPDVSATNIRVASGDWIELKRKYSALLIQLDRLRSELVRVDSAYRPTGEWSIREIVGHLIDCDRDIWWPRIEALKTGVRPYFRNIDQVALIEKHRWQSLPLEDILAQIMRVRWSNAVKLNEISEVALDNVGEHERLGELTITGILQILVAHDAHYLSKLRLRVQESRAAHEISFA